MVADLSGSFFTRLDAISTRKPSTPLSIQKEMMFLSSRRIAIGPGASTACSQGCAGSGLAKPKFKAGCVSKKFLI